MEDRYTSWSRVCCGARMQSCSRGNSCGGFEQPLCGFFAWKGSFYISYVQDGKTRFCRLNAEYGEELLFEVESDHSMRKMVVSDDVIYVLWNEDAAEMLAHHKALSHILRAYAFDGTVVETPVPESTDVAYSPKYGLIYGLERRGWGMRCAP